MEEEIISGRNFDTISPSAKSLLLLKGFTNIPYAKLTARLLTQNESFNAYSKTRDFSFWARVLHFESRYWSINNLLEDLYVKNILELSSGYSFRGLETVKQHGFHYIDTDLPEVINTKKELIKKLIPQGTLQPENLELVPLNCFDENQFTDLVSHFPEGPVAIINEGLLMYFSLEEKENLCRIIHKILTARGGYWITADIYIKKMQGNINIRVDERTIDFFKRHNIEDNKFRSFEEAEAFFTRMGFIVDKEADVNHSRLSSMKNFMKNMPLKELFTLRKKGRIQKTWRLRVS